MLEKTPERIVAHPEAAAGQLAEHSSRREIRLLSDPRKNPVPFTRHKIRPAAAHLQRRGHFTTLATLTMNVLATERQVLPAATARSRNAKE